MNILCVNDSGLQGGGAETRIRLLLESFAERDEIQSIIFVCQEEYAAISVSKLLQKKLTIIALKGHWTSHAPVLTNLFETYAIDLVQLHTSLGLSPQIVSYAKRKRIPVIWFAHDYWPLCGYRSFINVKTNAKNKCNGPSFKECVTCIGLKSYARLKLFRHWMKGVTVAIAPAKRFQRISEENDFLKGKWQLMDPWVDLQNFTWQEQNVKKPTFIYVGSLKAYKGIWTLAEAFVRLKQQGSLAQLHLVGDQELEFQNELQDYFKNNHVNDAVRWSGKMNAAELTQVYAVSTAVIFPSVCEESFGLVWVEAMAVGIPVLVSDRTGVAEHQQKSVTVFDPENIDSLVAAMRQLERRDVVSQEDLEKSSLYARSTFNVKHASDQILTLYQNLSENVDHACSKQ